MSRGRRGAFPASQRPAAVEGGGEDWGGGTGPPPLHRTHLWNVLALTEQRRRRAQATLSPSARPQRQAAQPIGGEPAQVRWSLVYAPRQSHLSPPLLLAELHSSPQPALSSGPGFLQLPSPPPPFPEAFTVSRERARRDGVVRRRGRALSVWAPGVRKAVGFPTLPFRPVRVPARILAAAVGSHPVSSVPPGTPVVGSWGRRFFSHIP